MRRQCDSCATPYEAQRPNSRFCSESCRKKAARGTSAPPLVPIAEPGPTAISTRARVLAELEAVDRAETYLGACALALADRIDQATAVMGYAALIKELRSTMEAATAGVKAAADPIDELRQRRDRKYAG